MRFGNHSKQWLAATGVWLLACAPASAARLPDWAKAIADDPNLTAEIAVDSGDSFVVLLTERVLSFDASGRAEVRDRIAKLALDESDDDVALGAVLLGSNWEPTKTRAWHLPPGGRAKKSSKESIVEISDTSMFRTDSRARSIVVDDVEPGSLIFFEFRADWTPFSLSDLHRFGGSESVRTARLIIEAPPAWEVAHEWIGEGPGPEPDAAPGRLVWEIHDILSPEREPLSDTAADTGPVLAVSLQPSPPLAPEGPAVFATWNDVSAWITGLTDDRASLGADQYEGWADAATDADAVTSMVATVVRVRDRVRYVAKEVGIDGYRPGHAVETSRNLWGDCKAKSTLLQALLEHQGITAFPVLVHASSRTTVGERVPTLASFNHMITAIQVGDLSLPDHLHSAVVDDATLGRLLIVDSTDEFSSPGSLPSAYAGHRALVVRGTEGHLITLPGTEPRDHRVEQLLDIEVGSSGEVLFTRTRSLFGQPAARYRLDRRSAGRDWREEIEYEIRDQWIGARVRAVDIEEETASGMAIESVSWTVRPIWSEDGDRRLQLFAHVFRGLPRVSLRRRTVPVAYGYPRIIRSEVRLTGFPTHAELPKPINQSGEGWSVSTEYGVEGSILSATGEMIVDKLRFTPAEFDDLRQLYRASAAIQRASAAIEVPSAGAETGR
jgi:hypothetical protein